MCCCMCSLVEILCLLEEKIGLVCLQLPHDMHAMETFDIQPTSELSLFSFKLSKLVDISTSCDKQRAFERNQNLENSCLMPWTTIV